MRKSTGQTGLTIPSQYEINLMQRVRASYRKSGASLSAAAFRFPATPHPANTLRMNPILHMFRVHYSILILNSKLNFGKRKVDIHEESVYDTKLMELGITMHSGGV